MFGLCSHISKGDEKGHSNCLLVDFGKAVAISICIMNKNAWCKNIYISSSQIQNVNFHQKCSTPPPPPKKKSNSITVYQFYKLSSVRDLLPDCFLLT